MVILMIHNMVMVKVNIFEAKARLSEYLDRVAQGEQVVICKRNHPVAELRPIELARTTPRPIGGLEGKIVIPPSFFDPLPDEIIASFYPETDPRAVKAAEEQMTYGPKKQSRVKRQSSARRRRA